jgi:hypothetical protein
MATKRQRWTRGAILRIPLGNGFHAYAQMIDAPEYAFFYIQSASDLLPTEIASHNVLFRLRVMKTAHSPKATLPPP